MVESLERRQLLSTVASGTSLDTDFGRGGQVTLGTDIAGPVAGVDSGGRIYLLNGTHVTRLTPAGNIDTIYGTGGTITIDVGVPGFAVGPVAVQPDGKLLVGGTFHENPGLLSPIDAVLARLNTDGTLDPTFAGDGTVTIVTNSGNGIDVLNVLPGGKILVLGDDYDASIGLADPGMVNDQTDLFRFNGNGTPDTTFASNGRRAFQVPGLVYSTPSHFVVAPDGKIVVAGSGIVSDTGPDSVFVLRFTADGAPDPTFGSGGVESGITGTPLAEPDGGVLLLSTGAGTWSMQRLNASGFVDPSFGTQGTVHTNIGTPGDPSAATTNSMYGATALPDDSILAVGFVSQFTQLAIVHYLPNGTLDRNFARQGRELHPFPQGSTSGSVFAQSDGKLLVRSGTGLVRIVPPAPGAPATPPPISPPATGGPAAPSPISASSIQVRGLGSIVLDGKRGTATFTIANTGTTRALGLVDIRIVASSSFTAAGVDLGAATTLATATRVLRLPPGRSRTFAFHVTIPSSLQAGTYELAGTFTPEGGLANAVGSNQTAAGPVIQVAAPAADLAVAFAGTTPALHAGRSTAVTLQFTNIGNTTAVGNIDVSVYASGDQILDPADQTLATIAGLPIRLRAEKSRRVRLVLRPDPGTPAGSYFLIASTAPNIAPADSNAANDTATSTTTLTV